jgi:hypothetical protein
MPAVCIVLEVLLAIDRALYPETDTDVASWFDAVEAAGAVVTGVGEAAVELPPPPPHAVRPKILKATVIDPINREFILRLFVTNIN